MKKLFRLAFVVVVLAACAAALLRDSPWWTFIALHRALSDRDVEGVERLVALERFAASSTTALGSVLSADVAGGDDLGSRLLGAVIDSVARGVGEATAREAAAEMRRAIRDGRLERQVGPFVVDDGFAALGAIHTRPDGALVELKGTCGGAPATLTLELERYDDGPFGGRPRRFVIVGVDATSAQALARQCRAAPAPVAGTPRSHR